MLLFPFPFAGLEDAYFSIKRVSRKDSDRRLPVVTLQDYYEILDRISKKLTLEDVRNHQIEAVNPENGTEMASFSIYQSLYFELKWNGNAYFLESGVWYRVSTKFLKKIDAFIDQLLARQYQLSYPYKVVQISLEAHKAKRNMEYVFNQHLAEHLNSSGLTQLLDSNTVHEGRSQIEIADILHRDKVGEIYLFHNKYNHGASSLSHLFSQGLVSIESLLDAGFRQKANTKISEPKLFFGDSFGTERSNYHVVYGIIMPRNNKGSFLLPLFGKINLEHFANSLVKLGFSVDVTIIEAVDG